MSIVGELKYFLGLLVTQSEKWDLHLTKYLCQKLASEVWDESMQGS